MAKIGPIVVTLEADLRWVRVAVIALMPLVALRLLSLDRAAYLASRLARIKVADR